MKQFEQRGVSHKETKRTRGHQSDMLKLGVGCAYAVFELQSVLV